MVLRTHDSTKLRTTTEAQGAGIQGSVTVSLTPSATLTRERVVSSDVSTRIFPAGTTSYEEPGIGDIILTGIENTTTFGTHSLISGSIIAGIEAFDNLFVINEDHVVGREFGVVEGWHEFDAWDNPPATFGDFELIQELYVTPTGFDGSEETFPSGFMVTLDIVYDLAPGLDASSDLVFGDLEAFFGVVENNWIEDTPISNSWKRTT